MHASLLPGIHRTSLPGPLNPCLTPALYAVQLFQHDGAPVAAAPPVFGSTAPAADMSDSNYHPPGGSGSAGFGGGGPANTLDEPVWETVRHHALLSCDPVIA